MRLLDLYLLRELLPPFGLGLLIFTFVLLMDKIMRIVDWIVRQGLPFPDVAKIFACLLPNFLILTLPTALLLAVLLAFSRLQDDNELDALKASGVSLYRLLPAVFFLGVVVFSSCLFLTTWAAPRSMQTFQRLVFSAAGRNLFLGLKERVFFDEFPGFVLYVEHVDPEREELEGVFLADEHFPEGAMYYLARRGRIRSDTETGMLTLELADGTLHRNVPNRDLYQIATFDTYRVRIDLAAMLAPQEERSRKAEELTLEELRDEARRRAESGRDASKYWIAYHQRLALPFGAIVFCILGVPLALLSPRSAKYTGFTLSIAVVLAYFVLLKGGSGLVRAMGVPASLGAWLPNLILGALGVYLFWQKSEEKPFRRVARVEEALLNVQERAMRKGFRRSV